MDYEIVQSGAFAALKVFLRKGEFIKAESGAMVAMSAQLDMEGKLEGGVLSSIGRMFTGETLFFQTLRATRGSGMALLAPAMLGDVVDVLLDGSYTMCVQKRSFLAAEQSVEISTKMQSVRKGLFSGEGFFITKLSGAGYAFLNAHGAIHVLSLAEGEEFLIDNGHLVAWPEYMEYEVAVGASGILSSMTSGEGIVLRFKGPGTVLIQTRNIDAFASWVKSVAATASRG